MIGDAILTLLTTIIRAKKIFFFADFSYAPPHAFIRHSFAG
jgi:hypothetical protein